MKKILFTKLLSLVPILVLSQNINLKGKVINSVTGEPVVYATVGLIKANRGISTDELGHFELENVDGHDTLVVSCVGFKKYFLSISEIKEGKIRLIPAILELPLLTVKPRKSKKIIINDFEVKDIRVYWSTKMIDTSSLKQLAQYFENPGGATWFVRDLKLVRYNWYDSRQERKVKFRLNFYGIDEMGKPDGKDICESILVEDRKNKLIKIDLSQYNIIMPPKGFFVTIEWIKIKENFHLFSYTSLNKEIKTDYSYKPSIGMIQFKDKNEVFRLDYRDVWHKSRHFYRKLPLKTKEEEECSRLAISLTLSD